MSLMKATALDLSPGQHVTHPRHKWVPIVGAEWCTECEMTRRLTPNNRDYTHHRADGVALGPKCGPCPGSTSALKGTDDG